MSIDNSEKYSVRYSVACKGPEAYGVGEKIIRFPDVGAAIQCLQRDIRGSMAIKLDIQTA